MKREDYDLGFLLKYENIAWYDGKKVRILDRRIYPRKIEFVECNTYFEVAKAIKDMVTQSGGPYTAAGMGMALAAKELEGKKEVEILKGLKLASKTLSTARPTTSKKMEEVTEKCLEVGINALKKGEDMDKAIFVHTLKELNDKYIRINKRAKHLVDLIPDSSSIMTQCFAETIVGLMLREADLQGKNIKLYVPETRPFFQGARLTASVAIDQNVETIVITDNMVGYVLGNKDIDIFTSAADIITQDGHVINKIGTFQIALLCDYYNIPYYVTGNPDKYHKDLSTVKIEERSSMESLKSLGELIVKEGVKGYYPAFDITPPKLVSAVITDKGIYSPYNLKNI